MRYTIKKEDILPLLTRVNNIIEKKSTQKIRTNILIHARHEKIELIGFDNEMKISGCVTATIEEEGSITVTAQKFFDIVRSLPNNAQIEVQVIDHLMHINCGASKFHLATIPAEEYPLPDAYIFDQKLSLEAKDLMSLINAVKFSMAANDVRHYLNGMLLDFTATEIVSASTDGHRLSVASIPNSSNIQDAKLIVPRKAIFELASWLANENGSIAIDLSSSHIQFSFANIVVTSTLINADYPLYESVIPAVSERLIVIPKQDFKSSLQRSKILAGDIGVGVCLSFASWSLGLSAKNMENESVEDKLEINYDGEPIKISFNINYLLDVINVLDSENITISLQDSQSSCLIYDADKENARYIIMPMNI